MLYHIFKKPVQSKNKTIHRWYYYFIDPLTGKKVQKVCKGCKTQAEANAYVTSLQDVDADSFKTVHDICKDMFIPYSDHIQRLEALGKKYTLRTIQQNRHFIELIDEQFGNIPIEELQVKTVTNYLISLDEYSGSWKNSYLQTLGKIYEEASWHCNKVIPKPNFPSFRRNSKKADVFSKDELIMFFQAKNFTNYRDYLFFLLTYEAGLRLGETRGIRPKQFIFEKNALIIDGFCKKNGERTNYNKKGSDEDSKLRVVILSDMIVEKIKNYINGNGIQPDDFVFNRGVYYPVRQEYLESVFQRALKKSGIIKDDRKLVPHSLRFTYVTRLRRNVNAEDVKKMVGHSSIEMTDYYTRAAIPEMVEGLKDVRPAVNMLFE